MDYDDQSMVIDTSPERAMCRPPFDDVSKAVFDQLDLFSVISLATERSVLGKLCVDEIDSRGTPQRRAETTDPLDFDEFARRYGSGRYKVQITRKGSPGGTLAIREVTISDRALTSSPMQGYSPSTHTPSARVEPIPAGVGAPSPQSPELLELVRKQQAVIDELHEEKRRLEARRERDRFEGQIAELRSEIKALASRGPAPGADRDRDYERDLLQMILKFAQDKPEPKIVEQTSSDPLAQVKSTKELVKAIKDLMPEQAESGTFDKLMIALERVAPQVAEGLAAVAARKAQAAPEPAAQTAQAGPPQLSHQRIVDDATSNPRPDSAPEASSDGDFEEIDVSDIVWHFLRDVAHAVGKDASPREALHAGFDAVKRLSGAEGVNELVKDLTPWLRADLTSETNETDFRRYLLDNVPLMYRTLVAGKLKDVEIRRQVLDVMTELRRVVDGLAEADEASIAFLNEFVGS